MTVMPTVDEVVEAFLAIAKATDEATERYRQVLRECLAEGTAEGVSGRQAEISRRTGRTREAIRQDAMPAEQREAIRKAEADRRAAKKATSGRKPGKASGE